MITTVSLVNTHHLIVSIFFLTMRTVFFLEELNHLGYPQDT